MQQLPLGVRIPDRAVFESFLPARNLQAVEHALRVASGTATGGTWICGQAAAGKTHLLQAVCARASESGSRAGYFPLVELASLGVGVLEGLTLLECVCLDDLDRVVGEWNGSGRSSRCCVKSRRRRTAGRRRQGASRTSVLEAAGPGLTLHCCGDLSVRELDERSNRRLCNCGPGCGD